MEYTAISTLLRDNTRQLAGGSALSEWTSAIIGACLQDRRYHAAGGLIVPQSGKDEGRPVMIDLQRLQGWEPAVDEKLENLWRSQAPATSFPFSLGNDLVCIYEPICSALDSPIGYIYAVCNTNNTDTCTRSVRMASDLVSLSLARHKLTTSFHNLTLAPAQPDISLHEYAKSAAGLCRASMGVDAVIVWELPANDMTLRVIATAFQPATAKNHHLPDTQPQFQIAITVGKGFVGHAAAKKTSVTIDDVHDEARLNTLGLPTPEQPGILKQFGWRAITITPLILRDKVIGVIASYGIRPNAFGEMDRMIQRAFSERMVAAFASIYRIQELTELEVRLQKEAPAIEAGWEAIRVAHDLRDDLWVASNSLRAASDLAKPYPSIRKSLHVALRNVKSAHEKTSLLTRSSGNKSPHFTETNVSELLVRCRKDLTLFTLPEDITVTVQCDSMINAEMDEELMRRALNNILSNALYFLKGMTHRSNKVILLGATASENEVTITCEDNGPGIPEESLSEIFKSYYTTKGDKGLGFGLAITKDIVENIHRGAVTANSQWGVWSKFFITIPRKYARI